ncbi:hypothetical protein BD769DRAFT_339113 [Suillus cothurnatus]|nr:hypothetical protein BD769DRAFT_339113 [Suillus cothurnatus]
MNPKDSRTVLIVLLWTISDEIMLPIVNVLKHVLKNKVPLFPLHAANPFLTKADRSRKEPCLEELYICSYTPTILALIRSRWMMKQCMAPFFVAIEQDQPGARQGALGCRQRGRACPEACPCNNQACYYFWRRSYTGRCTRSFAKEHLGKLNLP